MCTDGPQGLCLSAGLAFLHGQLEGCPGQGPLRAPSTLHSPGAPVSLTPPPEGADLTIYGSLHQACSAAAPSCPRSRGSSQASKAHFSLPAQAQLSPKIIC